MPFTTVAASPARRRRHPLGFHAAVCNFNAFHLLLVLACLHCYLIEVIISYHFRVSRTQISIFYSFLKYSITLYVYSSIDILSFQLLLQDRIHDGECYAAIAYAIDADAASGWLGSP